MSDRPYPYSGRRSPLWLCTYGLRAEKLAKEDLAEHATRILLTEGTVLFQDGGGANRIIWFRVENPADRESAWIRVGELEIPDEGRLADLREGWRVYRDIVVPDELLDCVRKVHSEQRGHHARTQETLAQAQRELNEHWPVLACLTETALPYIQDSTLPIFLQTPGGNFGGGRPPGKR